MATHPAGVSITEWETCAEAMHPRAATVAVDLLRNEYALSGIVEISDEVIAEIVDRVYLPLVSR